MIVSARRENSPSPSTQVTYTIHIPNCVCEQAADSTCNGCTAAEVAEADCELFPRVEERQVDDHAGKKRALCQSQEQATCKEASIILRQACQACNNAPEDRYATDESCRMKLFQEDCGGNFAGLLIVIELAMEELLQPGLDAYNVGRKENGGCGLELVVFQVEISFQPV